MRCRTPREEANTDAGDTHVSTVPSPGFKLGSNEERSTRGLSDGEIPYNLSSSLLPASNQETAFDGDWLENVFGPTASEHCDDSVITRLFEQGPRLFDNSIWNSSADDEFPPSTLGSFSENESWLLLTNDNNIPIPGHFDQRTRDNLLAIFSKNTPVDHPQPEFPSVMVMNILAHRFLTRHDTKTDSWIHTPTFSSGPKSVELAGMVVAASALSTQFHGLRQFGYQLHKTLQPVILRKVSVSASMLNGLELFTDKLANSWKAGRRCILGYSFFKHALSGLNWISGMDRAMVSIKLGGLLASFTMYVRALLGSILVS